ncbi:hypothetical protein [Baaleninema simplex]|uniref:hypothetical protein n=1 Tax=Baaleninema simplex TaxID=2862350 RepID=UPI00034C69D6|nr:hypothetical protein [Baaleninema simplex]
MSEFKNNLKIIKKWLKSNQPDYYSELQDGFDREELEDYLKPVPFLLPSEFYDLYQWHDGMTFDDDFFAAQLFPGYTFNSLSVAFAIREEISEWVDDILLYRIRYENEIWIEHSGILNNYLLPIFTLDEFDHICILGKSDRREASPLISIYIQDSIFLAYDSLATAIKTIATCYQTGAYYNFELPDGEQELRDDPQQAKEVWKRYNPQSYNALLRQYGENGF